MDTTIQLAKELISRASITPLDEGCQDLIAKRLKNIGFKIEQMPFGEVSNLWATYGSEGPLLVLLGHTDVVPPGSLEDWKKDPFTPAEDDGLLYGRGAADMKGSIAAFVTAIETLLSKEPNLKGRIGLMLTSDEEGPSVNGVKKIINELKNRNEKIHWCLVGEPTADIEVGDVIKIGRRGSIGAKIIIEGIQGHIAYPQKAKNPIHAFADALSEITKLEWKDNTGKFQDSILQVSNINAGTGSSNVIPGNLVFDINVRFSPTTSSEEIIQSVENILNKYSLDFKTDWKESGLPFLTTNQTLINAVKDSIEEITGLKPKETTDGGTSDGRFIAPTGSEVVELGPVNASIHKINECVSIKDLKILSEIYEKIILKILT
ncbi:MAG: succinyl-diaminopimelate desuccinylase [SAR86 cluster bacterium]|jgi:succinyl-diaminopimelate desuccinylase|nr:succinyl-diaminopimelate desuccinylase [SAR86 cluster bacterium]